MDICLPFQGLGCALSFLDAFQRGPEVLFSLDKAGAGWEDILLEFLLLGAIISQTPSFTVFLISAPPILYVLIYFFFHYRSHSTFFCISFRCTASQSDNPVLHKVFPLVFPVPPAQYISITVLLTMSPALYSTSSFLFRNYQCILPNPFAFVTQSPNPLPAGNHLPILCICKSIAVLFVCLYCPLNPTYK